MQIERGRGLQFLSKVRSQILGGFHKENLISDAVPSASSSGKKKETNSAAEGREEEDEEEEEEMKEEDER